jgi:hypothetical protein
MFQNYIEWLPSKKIQNLQLQQIVTFAQFRNKTKLQIKNIFKLHISETKSENILSLHPKKILENKSPF